MHSILRVFHRRDAVPSCKVSVVGRILCLDMCHVAQVYESRSCRLFDMEQSHCIVLGYLNSSACTPIWKLQASDRVADAAVAECGSRDGLIESRGDRILEVCVQQTYL